MIIKTIEMKVGNINVVTSDQSSDDANANMETKRKIKNVIPPPSFTKAWNALALMAYDIFGYNDLQNIALNDDTLTQTQVTAVQNLESFFQSQKEKFKFVLEKAEFKTGDNGPSVIISGLRPNIDGNLSKMVSHEVFYAGDTSIGYEPELKARVELLRKETMKMLTTIIETHQFELFPEESHLKAV